MDKSRGSANAATEHELLSIATRLQQISAQLVERSRSASISSKHTSVPSGPSGNPITPTAILPEDATSHTSPASEPPPSPNKRGLRPSFYPHAPSIRLDTFHSADQVEFLDALKLKTFEGFYNLSAALFAFALIYLLTRNILEKGWQLHINDFICFEVSVPSIEVLCHQADIGIFLDRCNETWGSSLQRLVVFCCSATAFTCWRFCCSKASFPMRYLQGLTSSCR